MGIRGNRRSDRRIVILNLISEICRVGETLCDFFFPLFFLYISLFFFFFFSVEAKQSVYNIVNSSFQWPVKHWLFQNKFYLYTPTST